MAYSEANIQDVVSSMTQAAQKDRNSKFYGEVKDKEKKLAKKKKLVEIKYKDTIIKTTNPELWQKKINRGEIY